MARGFIDKAGKAIKKLFSKKKGKLVSKGGTNSKDIKAFMDAAEWNKRMTAIKMDPKLEKLFKTRSKSNLGRNIRDVGAGTVGYHIAKGQDKKARHGGHVVPGKFLRQGDIR